MKALGTCKLRLQNPKTSQKYMVKFAIVKEELTHLLSRNAAEKMKLITVNYNKFESVSGEVEDKHCYFISMAVCGQAPRVSE